MADWLLKFARFEAQLKWVAPALGLLGAVAIIRDWYPWTMFISLPFYLICVYCAWLHTERQLIWINVVFLSIYAVGIWNYFA